MSNRREPCLMCHGPEQLRAAGIDLTLGAPVCCGHGRQIDDAARADREAHPDGHCTATCGCMSLEELDAALATRKEADR